MKRNIAIFITIGFLFTILNAQQLPKPDNSVLIRQILSYADSMLKQGEYDKAIAAYSEIIKIDPNSLYSFDLKDNEVDDFHSQCIADSDCITNSFTYLTHISIARTYLE